MELNISNAPLQGAEAEDALLAGNAGATIYQSAAFAESVRRNGFFDVRRIRVMEGDATAASLNVLIARGGIAGKIFPRMMWFHGPLIFRKEKAREACRLAMEGAAEVAKKEGVFSADEILPPYLDGNAPDLSNCFSGAGFKSEDWATFVVDLGPKLEDIFAGIDKSCRKNIRSCEENGIELKKVSEEGEVREYNELLKDFRKRAGLPLPPLYPSLGLWKDLHGKYLDLFVAKKKNEIISGMGALKFNGIIFEVAVARSEYEVENKVYPQDLIKWGIIGNGKQEGARIYDLGGVSPNPTNEKEAGIYRFKKKWGTRMVSYRKYSKVYSKGKQGIYEFIKSLRGRRA